nr:IS3 family transposase [Neisseria meningitidis]
MGKKCGRKNATRRRVKAMPSVELLLVIVGLPRGTFYYQLAVQSAEDKYADLKRHIHDIYRRHKGRYGYRRIAAAIRHAGTPVNHKKVSRLMAKTGLKAVIWRRKYRSFKGEVGKIAPNILRRCFHAEKPNEKWVTDVTEFNVGGEKIYLSPIMDLFNGEIVSYRIQTRPTFDLAGEILKGAPEKPRSSEKPILHSDQGWQYQMFFDSDGILYGRIGGLNLNQDKARQCCTGLNLIHYTTTIESS